MICLLYQAKQDEHVNDARYTLFSNSKKIPPPHSLPPMKDALYLHFDRANYQCQQWKMARNRCHIVPNPDNHGWVEGNGSLAVRWLTSKPAPEVILEFVSCSCRKRECTTNQCG